MDLLYSEILHFFISIFIWYIVYKNFFKSYLVYFFALLGWFFIDFDHLIDFWMIFPFSLNLWDFFSWKNFLESQKAYIFFHGWEYVALLLIIFCGVKSKIKYYIFVFALSIWAHLLVDVYTNEASFTWYSVTYRMINDFDLSAMWCKR